MASRPSYRGRYKGQKVGYWLWNGFGWEDSRVTSGGNGSASAGLPFTGNLPSFGSNPLSNLNFNNLKLDLDLDFSGLDFGNITIPEPPAPPSYPARGTEKERICRGNLTVIVRHNGTGGTYQDAGQLIIGSCGYTPPPPSPVRGTSAGTECQGTTRVRKLHNGSGGYYYETIERNSRTCGYSPPPPPTPPILMVEEDDTADSGLVLQNDGFDNVPPLFDFGNNDANGTVGSSVITPDNDSSGGSGIRGGGNPTNQPTIFFDEVGGGSSGQTGMNTSGPTGGGNPITSGPSSFPIVTLYGPYPDICTAHDQKKAKGRVGLVSDRDFGDVFEVQTFYSSIERTGGFLAGNDNPFGGDTFTEERTEKKKFRGGNQWYYDNATNGLIQIDNSGNNVRFVNEAEAIDDCKPKEIIPHTLNVKVNYVKGSNHPSSNSNVTSTKSGINGSTGQSKTFSTTLPYGNAQLETYGTWTAQNSTKSSTSVYKLERTTSTTGHIITLKKNGITVSSQTIRIPSNKHIRNIDSVEFNLSFDYEKTIPPDYLYVNPSEMSVTANSQTRQFEVKSTHSGTIVGIPDWVTMSSTFAADADGGQNFSIQFQQAPNKESESSPSTRTATITFTSSTGKTDTLQITQTMGEYVPKQKTSYTAIITIENKAGSNAPRTGTVNGTGVPEWRNMQWGETRQYPGYSIVLDASTTTEQTISTITGGTSNDTSTSIWTITSQWDGAQFKVRAKENGSTRYTKTYTIKGSGSGAYAAPNDGNYQFTLTWDFQEETKSDPYLIVAPPALNSPSKNGGSSQFIIESSSPVIVQSKPSWVTLPANILLETRQPISYAANDIEQQRVGRVVFVNSEGLTGEIVIAQPAAEKVPPTPNSFQVRIGTQYAPGTNAPTVGFVNSNGAPDLNGSWGGGGTYFTNLTVNTDQPGIERPLVIFTAKAGDKAALNNYKLFYTYENGGFDLMLKQDTGDGNYRQFENKHFNVGVGNQLIPTDGEMFNTLDWDFQKDKEPDTDPPKPPTLRIESQQNEVWATLEVYDPIENTTVFETGIATQFTLREGRLKDILSQNATTYQVKIVPRQGFTVEQWIQTSPTNLNLQPSQINRFISLDTTDTEYYWQFSVVKSTPPSRTIEVYPTVDSIEFNRKDTGDEVAIPYTSSTDTSYVNVKLPGGQEINNLPKNGKFELESDYFKSGLGRYTLIFCPYSSDGTKGNEKTVVVNVVEKSERFYPDIRDINWPRTIKGKDFVGFDVPFSFTYKSVFTDYVKVYLNDKDTRIGDKFGKVDRVKLNVQDLVNMTGKYTKSGDKYTFTFLLVPFNAQGQEILEGKTEKITIVFDKGDYTLDRNKVIKDLCDAFAANLDYKKFNEYTSTYLTHLLHFGDTNNEVISNWEADTETFRKYKIDPVTGRETNEKEEGGFDALVLKLYEPLETTVQPNQQVWITKIQSKPQLHEVIIRESSEESCPPLAGPNFSLVNNSNMGYELLDDMVASGSDSNMKLVNAFVSKSGIDTSKLDIQYVSGSITYDKTSDTYDSSSQRIYWENFSHFGSAEERVKNFYYKASLIENYKNVSASLSTGDASTSLSVIREREEQVVKIAQLENAFDGFEKFLYENTSSLSYPKDSSGELLGTGSADVLNWLTVTETSASIHDVENKNYLANNIPQFVKNDRENDDFVLFLDMIGHHFDILWTYVEALNRQRRLEHKLTRGVSDDMVREMLKSFGYTPNTTLDTAPLWEFALGQYNSANSARTDGTTKSVLTGKDRQNQIWRRILNNLPYLYKSKGTSRGLKATLSTYGIPESFLSVREFGGPHPTTGKRQKLTTVEQSFAAKMGGSSKISVPWHSGSPYPHTIEISVNTEKQQDGTIFKTDGMELKMFKDTGSLAYFEFHISGSGNIISASTDTIPFFNDTYTSFMVSRQYTSGSTHEGFDIYVKEPFQQRIRSQVSASVSASYGESSWESGSELVFEDFSGSIDNIKLWKTALSESIFNEHVLAPDMYNGNSISSSTEDLYFRLDFEVSENFAVSSSFSPSGSYKNTAPNLDLYGSTFATMSNFDSSSTYPYGGLNVIEKEITMTVPNTGLGDADKIRIEEQTLLTQLSPKARATKSALKEKPIDSNKIGMFISPTKNVNIDIVKAMGSTFSIDDFIGDPRDIYEEEYTELKKFRKSFFSKYTLNYDAFYNLIKYVDNSLFQALKGQAPSRSKVVTGLLIEPHILERNKRQRKKPSGIVFEGLVGTEDISKNSIIEISSENIPFEGVLTASNLQRPSGEQNGYETTLDYNFVENLSGSNASYESTIDYDFVENLSGSQLSYESTIDYDFVENLSGSQLSYESIISENINPTFSTQSVDASGNNNLSIIFEISGALDANTSGEYFRDNIVPSQDSDISRLGYGITAKDGHAIVTFLTPNGRRKERRKYYLITEEVTRKVKVLNISGDQSSGYKTVNETENVKKLTYVSISGSAPAVTGSITEVQPINGNLPSHYIYVKDTSTGLENSFFNGCKQTQATTIDGGPAFETFVTNPNTLKVSDSGRGSGEPILEVE